MCYNTSKYFEYFNIPKKYDVSFHCTFSRDASNWNYCSWTILYTRVAQIRFLNHYRCAFSSDLVKVYHANVARVRCLFIVYRSHTICQIRTVRENDNEDFVRVYSVCLRCAIFSYYLRYVKLLLCLKDFVQNATRIPISLRYTFLFDFSNFGCAPKDFVHTNAACLRLLYSAHLAYYRIRVISLFRNIEFVMWTLSNGTQNEHRI